MIIIYHICDKHDYITIVNDNIIIIYNNEKNQSFHSFYKSS